MNEKDMVSSFDEDDEDLSDYEDFLCETEQDGETFEQLLEEHDMNVEQARNKLDDFRTWFENTAKIISPKCRQKAYLCRSLLQYIEANGFNNDSLKMWCICMSQSSDFLFETLEGGDNERYIFTNFIHLCDDIDNFTFRIENEKKVREECISLLKNITFSEEKVSDFDVKHFYHVLSVDCGINGNAFEDNLRFAADRICHSSELSRLMPLSFYVLLSRYRTKMLDNPGFEPNFQKAFLPKEYLIDRDNGKNIDTINSHIDVYEAMCSYFSGCDKYLNDTGFSYISNAAKCSFAAWDEFPEFTRPLLVSLHDEYFSVFPNGMADNPFFSNKKMDCDDILDFPESEKKKAKRARIYENAKKYISCNTELCERYIDMIAEKTTDKSLPLILEIIEGSDIDTSLIKPSQVELVNAVIMDILMEQISENIKSSMLAAIIPVMEGCNLKE